MDTDRNRLTLNDYDFIVDVQNIDFSYGVGESRKQVLFNNSLRVKPGEIVIMTGPSGSGKTTLLTLIGTLREIRKGSLHVMGHELKSMDHVEQMLLRQSIGFIFQSHNLFNSLTALQNVKLSLDMLGLSPAEAKATATHMLEKLGLGDRVHYKPRKLSGGQRQRVAIARALVHRPTIVLADEPTAALDRDTARKVVDLLKKHAKEQAGTVFIVTHDIRVLDAADRIVTIIDGRIDSDVEVAAQVKTANVLRNVDMFQRLSPSALASVAPHTRREKHGPGAYVTNENGGGDKLCIIVSGAVEIVEEQGSVATRVATLGKGDFFSNRSATDAQSRTTSVRTLVPVELISLDKTKFMELLDKVPSFDQQVRESYFHGERM